MDACWESNYEERKTTTELSGSKDCPCAVGQPCHNRGLGSRQTRAPRSLLRDAGRCLSQKETATQRPTCWETVHIHSGAGKASAPTQPAGLSPSELPHGLHSPPAHLTRGLRHGRLSHSSELIRTLERTSFEKLASLSQRTNLEQRANHLSISSKQLRTHKDRWDRVGVG